MWSRDTHPCYNFSKRMVKALGARVDCNDDQMGLMDLGKMIKLAEGAGTHYMIDLGQFPIGIVDEDCITVCMAASPTRKTRGG